MEGVYKTSPDLSADFVAKVADHAAIYEPEGFDPILMAMFVPDRIELLSSTNDGKTAEVVVNRYWSTMVNEPLPMRVLLKQVEGAWLIDDVSLVMAASNKTPAETIEAFFVWDLSYSGSPRGKMGNIVSEKTYRSSPYLTVGFVRQVDELIASFSDASGFDPFFCAQILPISINVDAVLVQPTTEQGIQTARAVVRSPHFS